MDHLKQEKTLSSTKLGFHYFLDDERFKLEDARLWIKKLNEINAKWLVIDNPRERAVPEEFIREFSSTEINLIINFNEKLSSHYDLANIQSLLCVYGRWGVKFACLFKQPNLISTWGEIEWHNHSVVETYLDKFIQFSQSCIENNIKPVFSPLFPGGDFWDLAFLEESLTRLATNAQADILNNMVLSAYGWRWGHPIDWGTGGKQKWPKSKLFNNDQKVQNQKGFRTYEWYLEISEKVFGKRLPIFIFEAGFQNVSDFSDTGVSPNLSEEKSIIPNLLAGGNVYNPTNPDQLLAPIANEVIGCSLFILSAYKDKNLLPYRWFTSDGKPLETAHMFGANSMAESQNIEKSPPMFEKSPKRIHHKYRRYILISDALKSNMPALLENLDPYIRKYRPQIGFSKMNALDAAYILVITNNKESFSFDHDDGQSRTSVIKIITPNEINNLLSEY